MDCAIYIRVSSTGQVLKGHSLDAQEKAGIERCQREGWSYEIFERRGKVLRRKIWTIGLSSQEFWI